MSEPTRIDSRVWLVTGASSGLGKAAVQEVIASGERVAAVTRKAAALDDMVAQYGPSNLLVIEFDISKDKHVIPIFDKIKQHFGRLDVLLNNAGYGLTGELEATPDEEAEAQFEVNFWAVVRLCREGTKFMRENNPRTGGRILNVSSIGGFRANPTLAFYSASKFAVEGFTEALNKELPPSWNIKAIVVQPGGFKTEWNKGNMIRMKPHLAYTDPSAPGMLFRQMTDHVTYVGDVQKGAKAFIRISKLDNPPERIPLGADSVYLVKVKLKEIATELEAYKDISMSTNADDADLGFFQSQIDANVIEFQ